MRQYPGTWVPWSLRAISLPEWVLTSHSHRCWPSINQLLLTVGPGGNRCIWVGLGVVCPQACGERALCRGSDGEDCYPRGHWPGLRWCACPREGLLHPGAGQGVTDGAQRPTQRVAPDVGSAEGRGDGGGPGSAGTVQGLAGPGDMLPRGTQDRSLWEEAAAQSAGFGSV